MRPQGGGKEASTTRYRKRKPVVHPLSQTDGQVYEHRIALFNKIGTGPSNCHWCQKPIEWDTEPKITADHLDGDKWNNIPDNIVPSCFGCNVSRAQIKERCLRGHLFTPENTYIRPDGGGRQCRCHHDLLNGSPAVNNTVD